MSSWRHNDRSDRLWKVVYTKVALVYHLGNKDDAGNWLKFNYICTHRSRRYHVKDNTSNDCSIDCAHYPQRPRSHE